MIYPIVAYGDSVLREKAVEIAEGTDVEQLAEDMLATMKLANGVGLAAPQIGKSLRMFVVDLEPFFEQKGSNETFSKVLINPVLKVDEAVPPSTYEEGCLSIPDLLVEVPRREKVVIRYFDVSWQLHEDVWAGFPARVMQHEYDHLEGTLHIDYASPLRKRLIKNKLTKISQGKIDAPYKMRFPS